MLLSEMPEYAGSVKDFADSVSGQRRLLRSLMNVREPGELEPEFLKLQDGLLL